MLQSPIKKSTFEIAAQERAWRFAKDPAEALLSALRTRGEAPVTAGVFQARLFRFLDLDENLRPKHCPEGNQGALSAYLTRTLAPRLKSLIAEFRAVYGRYSYGSSPELCYRVLETLVAVRITIDSLRSEFPEGSPIENDLSRCSRIALSGRDELVEAQRKGGALSNVRAYLDRVAATGPMPLLGDVLSVRFDIVPHYLGQGDDFIPRLKVLGNIAQLNVWNRTGDVLLAASSLYLGQAKKITPEQQLQALQILDDAEQCVRKELSGFFKECVDRGGEPTVQAFNAVAHNSSALMDANGDITLTNFCKHGSVLSSLKLMLYPHLPVVEQNGLRLTVGIIIRSSLLTYERNIRTRSLVTTNPMDVVRLGKFKREGMPSLLRVFAEASDSDTVSEVYPAIFKKVVAQGDWPQAATLIAIRLWGERPNSISGNQCIEEGTAIVSTLIEQLELFRSRDDRDSGVELKTLLAILSKDFPTSTVPAVKSLCAELTRGTVRHVLGAFCSSDADGSDLRDVALSLAAKPISTSFEDQLRKTRDFTQIQNLVSRL